MALVTIRPALATDLPQIVSLDIQANANHPIIAIPWKQYSHAYGVFLSRHLHFLNHPKEYQFLVATSPSASKPGEEEILGFLTGAKPKSAIEGEPGVEWKPILPEGTNEKLFGYFLGALIGTKAKYKIGDVWELETLSISVDHQRKGVGSKLMEEWFKTVDADGRGVYILASKMGRGLYEKFGCKEVGLLATDLKDFGLEEPYVNFSMMREGRK
ncbi:hypothetical protein EG329_001182 [Mollisiaceae sp. DMI_Dod_QoI]|nr:hypothetical protein EG329_001182 [Helotiales sp. DMI_Dod_QoI]